MLPLEFFERLSWMYRAQMMDPWWRWYSGDPGPLRTHDGCRCLSERLELRKGRILWLHGRIRASRERPFML
jgi:hypothetical protein